MTLLLLILALLTGGRVYEDGSAVIPLGPVTVTVPAFDSPGDQIVVRLP